MRRLKENMCVNVVVLLCLSESDCSLGGSFSGVQCYD